MDLFPRRLYFDDMFDEVMPRTTAMKCDIYEEDGVYHIEMDLPGFDKKDIDISSDNGYITISASQKKDTEENENKKYIRRERISQEVTRRFYLEEVEEESIKAKFENGTLHITALKKEKVLPEKKTIQID